MVAVGRDVHAGCGMRDAGYTAHRTPHTAYRQGQASLEMAAAMIAALLLLAGCIKLVFWATERYYTRLQAYEGARTTAASVPFRTGQRWDGSYEPQQPLDLVN